MFCQSAKNEQIRMGSDFNLWHENIKLNRIEFDFYLWLKIQEMNVQVTIYCQFYEKNIVLFYKSDLLCVLQRVKYFY